MLMGMVLAHAGMAEGKEVTFFPSYGPSMRGGTANCSVIISSEEIATPVISTPDILIAMNEPSFREFESRVTEKGGIFINRSLVAGSPTRDDVELFEVEATRMAGDLGNLRVANMVMLGALAGATGIVTLPTLVRSIEAVLPQRRRGLLDLNIKALKKGNETISRSFSLSPERVDHGRKKRVTGV